jgi:hypothetical protein
MGFQPELNASGQAPRGVHFRLPLRVSQVSETTNEDPRCRHSDASAAEGASGDSCPDPVRAETLRVSFDDGVSWKSMPVKREGGQWIADGRRLTSGSVARR